MSRTVRSRKNKGFTTAWVFNSGSDEFLYATKKGKRVNVKDLSGENPKFDQTPFTSVENTTLSKRTRGLIKRELSSDAIYKSRHDEFEINLKQKYHREKLKSIAKDLTSGIEEHFLAIEEKGRIEEVPADDEFNFGYSLGGDDSTHQQNFKEFI